MIELWNKSRETQRERENKVQNDMSCLLSQSPKSSLLLFSCVLFIVTHPTSLFNSFAMQKPFTTTIHTTYETKNKCPFFVIVVHSMTDVEKKIVNFYITISLGNKHLWFKPRSM